ncbi:2-dehydropantoate 2-reductase [Bacillus sp. FJAT-29790]|uniref:2-dehydropantoate 2-reductase n=1 Tax=Bacillus sp. FJAT-29790 TaxID=1895002 RepID=UPI001C219FB1|nr:2-dehydropantoate 2-reductase [Bacillus sp. FJAT-29790]MBU8877712.1 2-dehydropantoate 2-reductase [Bacillus sp. FJAT-29790]
MKIGIIGGGSIGLLFAHYLSKDHQVCVYTRSKEQAKKLSIEGLIFEKGGKRINDSIHAAVLSDWRDQEDLTIIAVKQYDLQRVLDILAGITPSFKSSFLFLQNGMGHLNLLKELKANHIFVGMVEHGANKIGTNHVLHTGDGMTKLALYSGNSLSILKEMAAPLSSQFPFIIEADYHEMMTKKLIVNSCINPLTAILNVRNGELLENRYYKEIFKQLFLEICLILNIADKKSTFAHIKDVCRKTAANRSSMLKDLDEKRPTEVDAILGYVIEKANQRQMAAPLTESFYYLIKGKEYEERGK